MPSDARPSLWHSLRDRAYYRVMRLGNESLSQWFYDHSASFREWWGGFPPRQSAAFRQHNAATGIPDCFIDGKPYKGELLYPDLLVGEYPRKPGGDTGALHD